MPTMYWLHLHLKDQHYVYFNVDAEDLAMQFSKVEIKDLHLMDSML